MTARVEAIEKHRTRRPLDERGRAPGPGSILWDTFSDVTLAPFAIPILVMQTAHPDIGAAVARYSIYRDDPWGRLFRTAFSLMRFLYGGHGGKQSEHEAVDLRALHSKIRGTRPDGTKYHAIHPRSYRVVPDTFLDGVIRLRVALGRPLDAEEKEQLFQEYVELCLLFGLKRSHIEPTLEEFERYYDGLLLEVMTYNDTVAFLLEEMIKYGPKMRYLPFPESWWQAFYTRTFYPVIRTFTIGFLDARFREKHGIPWSDRDQKRYETYTKYVRTYANVMPRWARYNLVGLYVMAGGHGVKLMDYERLRRTLAKRRPEAVADDGE